MAFCLSTSSFIIRSMKIRKQTLIPLLLLSLVLALLAGCQDRGEVSPEDAAALQLIRMEQPDVVIDPNSIDFLQSQELDGRVYVLYTYNRNWNGRNQQCLAVTDTYQNLFSGWFAENGSASCPERDLEGVQATGVIDTFGGTFFHQGKQDMEHTFASGRVNQPEIVRVRVAWDDGLAQEAAVEQGAFLAIRSGEASIKAAVGLNEAGNEITRSR